MEKYKRRILLAIVCGFLLQMPSVNASDAGWTPLHGAARDGHLDSVQTLIQANFDINKGDDGGDTSLHKAANKGHTKIVQALIQAGADVDRANKDGETSLYEAAKYGHTDIAQALIQAGAEVNEANSGGWTPLHWAVYKGHAEVLRTLIKADAEVNAKDMYGWTPLLWALHQGRRDAVLELVTHGAELTDQIKGMQLFQQNPDFLRELETVADQRLNAIRDWCNNLDHAENLPRDVIDYCILPFALSESHKRRLAEICAVQRGSLSVNRNNGIK